MVVVIHDSDIGFIEVNCIHGNETSLQECRNSILGNHGCSPRKAAGVICTGGPYAGMGKSNRFVHGGNFSMRVANSTSARPGLNGSRQHPLVSNTVVRRRRTFTGTNDVYLEMVRLNHKVHSRRELQVKV